MAFAVLGLLIVIGIGVAFALKSKSRNGGTSEFLEADAPLSRSAATNEPARASSGASDSGTSMLDFASDLTRPSAAPVVLPEPEPEPEPEPAAATSGDSPMREAAPESSEALSVEVVGDALTPDEPIYFDVSDSDEPAPEPLVKARIDPIVRPEAASVPSVDADEVVMSRFKTASDRPKPHLAATPTESVSAGLLSADRGEVDDDIADAVEQVAEVDENGVTADEDAAEATSEPAKVVADPETIASPETVTAVVPPADDGGVTVPIADQAVSPLAAEDHQPEPEPESVVVSGLQPEPETDPVDHVLKALIGRAKSKQVGIAEVAAELVEQANLEDRDIDEVLADLVDRVDDEEQVVAGDRLEELTLFNDSVPRRPGQLTDFDRLDKNTKKRVIIRVLCLLVAMQEDNRLTPSEPRSEAETRHWPLSRAVWPVAAAEGDADDTDSKTQLPDRRLIRTKR